MSDIRGLVIQSRLDYIEKKLRNSGYQQVLSQLDEPVRQAIGEQVFPTNLYPFHLLHELDEAVGSSVEEPLETIFREIGRDHAALVLDRYFYNYIEAQQPQKFLFQIENLYPHLWEFGNYSYKQIASKEAEVTFSYDEDLHKSYCWFVQEFLKTGTEICGGKSVELTEESCEAEDGEACIYFLKWK
jgi:uncharacterized protein (TIGR02265 family)